MTDNNTQTPAPAHVSSKIDFPREKFMRLMTQRFFIAPSFEIYGGIAGLYDLGPPGTAIKANLLNLWRQHFVITENMLEVDCTSVTPEPVLVTSGHVAKFADLMVKDLKTGGCYRADHLLEQHLENLLTKKDIDAKKADEYKTVMAQADAYSKEEMGELLKKYFVKAPDTQNDLSDPEPFNLMFQTQIGPTGQIKGYLRPETAQGIFVNFKRLLEYNGGKLPFGSAQIGQAFRNEIAPRSGLLRVREFTLAEIEHFVNPNDKSHPKFEAISSQILVLFPRDLQTTTKATVELTVGEAVKKGIINNETLGYFIVRTYLFLTAAGIKKDRLRFRQHLKDEMAHYAADCWDAEIQTSYGWVECVGIADRSAFDLSAHSGATKQPLTAYVEFPDGPRVVDFVEVNVDKSLIGKAYKKPGQNLIKYLTELDNDAACKLMDTLAAKESTKVVLGKEEFELTNKMVSFKKTSKKVQGHHITPGVIEPSFGIGRILYSILEHSYYCRKTDEQRQVIGIPPALAPVKVSVFPLIQKGPIVTYIPKIVAALTEAGLSHKVDDTGSSIGRRYSRTDEVGIPFAITIDGETPTSDTVTVRERDTTAQVRVKTGEVAQVIQALVSNRTTWADVLQKYPKIEIKEDTE